MTTYSAGSASVEISPDFSGFVRELRTYLARVDADLSVQIRADTSVAAREIEELTRNRTMTIQVDADTRVAAAEIALLARNHNATINIHTNHQGAGVINTINNQLNQIIVNNNNVSNSSDRARGSLNAMGAVRFTALAGALTALIPIIGGVIGAAGALAGIFGAVGLTGAVGGSGIIGAFKAMGQASEGAAAAAEDHTAKLDALADAQQRVTDSQHNEQDALEAVTDAQKARTDAAKDAKDAIDDLNLAVNNGVRSEKGAEIAYRRAVVREQETLQKRAQGKATQLDVDSAAEDVAQAGQNITNVRVQNQQTIRKRDEANSKGVEGSDQVQAANKALEQAQYNVTQSQVATQTAIRDLARAQEAANTSAAEAAGNTDKLAEALAKLSPSAREFVLAMKELGPRWSELRKAVQEELFQGLGETVSGYFKRQADSMQDTLSQLAGGMNNAIKGIFDSFEQMWDRLKENGGLQRFIDAVNESLTHVGPGLALIGEAVIKFTTAAAPALGRLFEALGQLLNTTAEPLGRLGAVLADSLVILAPYLSRFINALADNLAPILPHLAETFGRILDALTPLLPDLGKLADKFLTLLDKLTPILEPLGRLINDGLKVLLDVINRLFGDDKSGATGTAAAIVTLLNALDDLTKKLGTLFETISNFTKVASEKIPHSGSGFSDYVTYIPIIGGWLGKADGGVVGRADGGLAGRKDGMLWGPGTGTSDSILGLDAMGIPTARVSRGEYVTDEQTTEKFLPLLRALPGLKTGGQVGKDAGNGDWAQNDSTANSNGVIQPDTQHVVAAVKSAFPSITDVGTYRASDPYPDHPSGRAADLMIPNYSTPEGKALGDKVAAFVEANAAQLGVEYYIWQQTYHPIGGTPNLMEDRGSPTANHMDHVHVTTKGNAGKGEITSPSTTSSTKSGTKSGTTTSDYSPTGTYVGPSSVDATSDLTELGKTQQDSLPVEYSLQGILSRAGSIFADGILGAFGLENSVLSSNNTYNKALNTTIDFYSKKQEQGLDPLSAPTTTPSVAPGVISTSPSTDTPALSGAPSVLNSTYKPDAGVEQWRPNVIAALQREGYEPSERNIQLTLAQMKSESGGNPGIVQQVQDVNSGGNEAQGLLQVIPGTFATYHNPSLPNDRTNPDANISAALRYYRARYGDNLGTQWGQGHGYDQGGEAHGKGFMFKDIIKPERVLNPSNTETFNSMLPLMESINAQGWRPNLPQNFGQSTPSNTGSVDRSINYGDVHVMDVGELMYQQNQAEAFRSMTIAGPGW